METKVFKSSENYPDIIGSSVDILKSGGILVYPTETVYGIGCSLFSIPAVEKLFAVKNRPGSLPLTANIASAQQASEIAIDIPDEFYLLADWFLPGPLSIILRKDTKVPDAVTSGMDTIAIRIPDNRCFLDILDAFGQPVAGTSANISGKGSFANPVEVISLFDGDVDLIIDDGESRIGIESTIITLAGEYPRIIRAGAILREDIEACLKRKLI